MEGGISIQSPIMEETPSLHAADETPLTVRFAPNLLTVDGTVRKFDLDPSELRREQSLYMKQVWRRRGSHAVAVRTSTCGAGAAQAALGPSHAAQHVVPQGTPRAAPHHGGAAHNRLAWCRRGIC
jgi:hypothetical protein